MIDENYMSTKNRSVEEFEKEYSVVLPKEYELFLNLYNGGIVSGNITVANGDDVFETEVEVLYGLTSITNNDIFISYFADEINGDDSLLCIGECCFGDKLYLSIKGEQYGGVYFCFHDEYAEDGKNVVVKVFNNFDELLQKIK